MIKPSKVVFISDELEDDFKSLKEGDAIKKGITRATGNEVKQSGKRENTAPALLAAENSREADLNVQNTE